jgi:hypothetical protein
MEISSDFFGMKELYSAVFKATVSMRVGEYVYEPGETILSFDDIQLSNISEPTKIATASGGKGNKARIMWEEHDPMQMQFNNGLISEMGLVFLTNAKLLESPTNESAYLSKREEIILDASGVGTLDKTCIITEPHFVYDISSGISKITGTFSSTEIDCGLANANKEVLVHYTYEYEGDLNVVVIDENRISEYLSFEGRYYITPDRGVNETGIIVMPKVKIISNLNLQLGSKATPIIHVFNVIAMPGRTPNSSSATMEMMQLPEDIDNDS